MRKKPYISFCISSYNRREMVKELVLHILSIQSEEIEVIVMDDHSGDGTIESLNEICDERLHTYYKETQEGGTLCWYDALEKGGGVWLFQIIDRDWINTELIERLIEILRELEEQKVGFAVGGERISGERDYQIYQEGLETINEFGLRYSHPTGQIFRRKEWNAIANRRNFFADEEYGIYPHGYIYSIMGNSLKGAYILIDICDKAHYNQRIIKTVSKVYASRKDKLEWFLPESRFNLLKLACENIELIENKEWYAKIILEKYIMFFFCVTREWHANCRNEILKMRYHCPDLKTNYLNLMVNGFDYIALFREYLENMDFWWADDSFYEALCDVDRQLVEWLLKWANGLRIEEKLIH